MGQHVLGLGHILDMVNHMPQRFEGPAKIHLSRLLVPGESRAL